MGHKIDKFCKGESTRKCWESETEYEEGEATRDHGGM
jgi:hypothetical protein